MLRITLPAASRSGLFILEGRLAGLWAKELLRVARAEGLGHGNIFDLREVLYVDSEGEDALRWLGRQGAKFITESAYGKDLCNRLKLQRVEDRHPDRPNGTRRQGSHGFTHRQGSQAGKLDGLVTADANQHPPAWRG